MAIISSYPTVVAEPNDLLIGTKIINTGTIINPTKTFRIQEVVDAALGYKVYTALLTQTGVNPPVATVLKNTTGGTIAFAYDNVGVYRAVITGANFTANKTAVFITTGLTGVAPNPADRQLVPTVTSNTEVTLTNLETGSAATTDELGETTTIEIRIYS